MLAARLMNSNMKLKVTSDFGRASIGFSLRERNAPALRIDQEEGKGIARNVPQIVGTMLDEVAG